MVRQPGWQTLARRYNSGVLDFGDETRLLVFCLVNAAVFGGAWFAASRRITISRSQAVLDAVLLAYTVQYAAVGLPGILHCLNAWSMDGVAVGCAGLMFAAAWRRPTLVLSCTAEPGIPRPTTRFFSAAQNRRSGFDRLFLIGIAIFVCSVIAMYVHSQASLPVISNDALTYHFPTAAQWLQQGKISLFQTWFFNPSNTYSPLAGSMFIVWLMAPFGSDVLARFVEVPPLLCVGIAMYRLCRELGVRPSVAGLVAGAAVLSRPIFLPCMMGKDDLFVVFFFIAILVALSPSRTRDPRSAARLGIALGLLLAMKYTIFLIVPVLLLAIDGPQWRPRQWLAALGVAACVAGPWYLRNWLVTGNPIFPMYSLFTTSASDAFHSLHGAMAVVIGGGYGLPLPTAAILGIGWIFALPRAWSNPIHRTCVVGILPALLLFYLKSPFPEVRFVLPVFLLLFAVSAAAIERSCPDEILAFVVGLIILAVSLATLFVQQFIRVTAEFAAVGLIAAAVGCLLIWWIEDRRVRWAGVLIALLLATFVYTYVNWKAYCRNYRETLFDDGGGYAVRYPELNQIWQFVNENIPQDATIAYTNIYLIYPLQGPGLQRQVVYAPTRPDEKSLADIGWLGSNLSGERLVPAAIRATIALANRDTWLANLRKTGAQYLIIGKGGLIGIPPEAKFAAEDPQRFKKMIECPGGWIYQINQDRTSRGK